METRGIRNNNPLNLTLTRDKWLGMREKQTDGRFCQFETMAYGWRATFIQLGRYYYNRHLYTIEKIVSTWAPPTENKTQAYIDTVCGIMKYDAKTPLGLPSMYPARWMKLAMAMGIVESGPRVTHDALSLLEGWEMSRKVLDAKKI